MSFCENCGAKLKDGIRFCSVCGYGDVNSKKIPDQKWYEKSISNWTALAIGVILVIFLLLIFPMSDPTPNQINNSQNFAENTTIQNQSLQIAEPYLSKIVFNDTNLREKANNIVKDCPEVDSRHECEVNAIYNYVIQNYTYRNDPRNAESIQSPTDTIQIGGGDCEDLSILLNSLLENIGVKTYLVLTDDHAYTLACGIDTEKLSPFISKTLAATFANEASVNEDANFVEENGNIFVINSTNEEFFLNAHQTQYHGGNGNVLAPPSQVSLYYNIKSSKPIDIFSVGSNIQLFSITNGFEFKYYCQKHEQVFSVLDKCENMTENGGLAIRNMGETGAKVSIDLIRKISTGIDPAIGKLITSYTIDGQNCIALDATFGKEGYAGEEGSDLKGEKSAFDPLTKEIVQLTN